MTTTTAATVAKGLLVRLAAKPDKEGEIERFLLEGRSLVAQEPDTTAWFAVRFGHADYGIFDVFADEQARSAHLSGAVATALSQRAGELFARSPEIERLDVLAHKLPTGGAGASEVTKGILLTFEPKAGHEDEVAEFLRGAQGIVEEEEGTRAWFAIRLENGRFGIFDVFPDNRARLAHLTGRVPRELAKHALGLLGSLPDIDKSDVLAAKLG